jgi:OmpW family
VERRAAGGSALHARHQSERGRQPGGRSETAAPDTDRAVQLSAERESASLRGLGANATLFFDEKTSGALAGADLSLRNSFGVAAQFGLDVDLSDSWFLSFDARWMDIDTRASLSGANLGVVHVEPLAAGISFGHRFGVKL